MTERVNLYTLMHDLAGQYQYLGFGDTSHLDENIIGLKGDLGFFKAANAAGYNVFALEKPPEQYEDDQNIRVSEREPEVFFDKMVALGVEPREIVGAFAAAAYDMTAVYPDSRYSPEMIVAVSEVYDVIEQSQDDRCDDVHLQAFFEKEPDITKVIVDNVYTGNEVIAGRIQEKMSLEQGHNAVSNLDKDVFLECIGDLPEDLKLFAPDKDGVSLAEKSAALGALTPVK